jgi:hypothetical protein
MGPGQSYLTLKNCLQNYFSGRRDQPTLPHMVIAYRWAPCWGYDPIYYAKNANQNSEADACRRPRNPTLRKISWIVVAICIWMAIIEIRFDIIRKLSTAGGKTCPTHGAPGGGKLENPAAGDSWSTHSYHVWTYFTSCAW